MDAPTLTTNRTRSHFLAELITFLYRLLKAAHRFDNVDVRREYTSLRPSSTRPASAQWRRRTAGRVVVWAFLVPSYIGARTTLEGRTLMKNKTRFQLVPMALVLVGLCLPGIPSLAAQSGDLDTCGAPGGMAAAREKARRLVRQIRTDLQGVENEVRNVPF